MLSDLSKTAAVDTHFHLFEADIAQAGARYIPAYDASLSNRQAKAQPLGATRGVLVQTSFMGNDNSWLLAELARCRDFLRGVAAVGADATLQTLEPLHRVGVRGNRLNLAGISHELIEWSKATPLWDALLSLGWQLELHTDMGLLPEVLMQLPDAMPLVIDHIGKSEAISVSDKTVPALGARSRRAKVHVKLRGAYRLGGLDAGALSRLWLGELGADRLLWGSDWPCTNHESLTDYPMLLRTLHDWLVDKAVIETILTTNPQRMSGGKFTWLPAPSCVLYPQHGKHISRSAQHRRASCLTVNATKPKRMGY